MSPVPLFAIGHVNDYHTKQRDFFHLPAFWIGIVPQFCDQLFKEIDGGKGGEGTQYEVLFSMLEIYMEEVRDLLNPKAGKGGLRVRQHPKKGFYGKLDSTHVACLPFAYAAKCIKSHQQIIVHNTKDTTVFNVYSIL